MKNNLLKSINILLIMATFSFVLSNCSAKKSSAIYQKKNGLVFYNEAHLKLVKAKIKSKDPYFLKNYEAIIKSGNKALNYVADPVNNKTLMPASNDKHDYLTYAPYRWPDTTKADGLPWIAKDGIINPVSRDLSTDNTRKTDFFNAINNLAFSYYFSDEPKYAQRAIDLIKVWYLNPATKVNPNMNFGQAVPGSSNGSKAGIQEWKPQSSVLNALQLFDKAGVLPRDVKIGMNDWLTKYLTWLTTDEMAISTKFTGQNHATSYSEQVVGLMMYLGKDTEAKTVIEDVKLSLIANQIMPDGSQPKEMGRTKSVNYSSENLWAFTQLTLMGRKLGIDLWDYESKDGRSLKKAFNYLSPFVLNPKDWPKKQITPGGVAKAIEEHMKPLFSKAATSIGVEIMNPDSKAYLKLSPLEALTYPPIEMLPEIR